MGFLRGSLVILVSFLLFVSLLVGNIFLVLSSSLSYDSLSSEITPLINNQVSDSFSGDSFEAMQEFCENKSNFEFNYNKFDFSLNIPCEEVFQGKQAVINHSVDAFLEKIYYDSYDCGFWSCITETKYPFVLMSAKAKDYWKNKFYIFLVASLVLASSLIFLVEKKLNSFILLGSLIFVTSLPLKFLDSIVAFLIPSVFEDFAFSFVSNANNVFLVMLIIGFVFLAVGILLKIFKTGDKIIDWFKNKKSKPKG